MKNKTLATPEMASVLVADLSQQVRMEIVSILRKLGFSKIDTCQNIAELKKACHLKPPDWILSSLFAQEKESAIAVLRTLADSPAPTIVTLLLEEGELSALPRLFEYGLTSFFPKMIRAEALSAEVTNLALEVERWKGEVPLIAASYLHQHLIKKGSFQELIAFHTQMSRLFPDEIRMMLLLAETKFAAKMGNDAMATLRQVVSLDPNLEAEVQALTTKYVGKIAKPPAEMSLLGATGLESCLVVDSDTDTKRCLEPILTEFNVKKVEFVANGLEAWEKINKEAPKLLITEWRVPNLSGPKLIQRVRALNNLNLPIVVVSSLLKREDFVLLQEMGVSGLVPKPIMKKDFLLHLNWALLQSVYPSEQASSESKILALLGSKKAKEAKSLIDAFLQTQTFSESRKKYIEAEWLYYNQKYTEAKDRAVESLKLAERDTISATSLLGKILMKLGDPLSAVKFFERASALSPANLERLCQLAEASVGAGLMDKATAAIEQAESIDAENVRVQTSAARVAVAAGDAKKAKQILVKTGQISPLVSFMNTQAVASVLAGDVPQGLRHYENTVQAIPDDFADVAASVRYNIALAHARAQQLNESQKVLAQLATDGAAPQRLKAKVVSLTQKVDKAKSSGTKLDLPAPKLQVEEEVDDDLDFVSLDSPSSGPKVDKAISQLTDRPKTMFGLYRIYKSATEHSEFAKSLA